VRLDLWLDVTCLYRTRSEAQKAIRGGKVEVNRQTGKPHRELKEGDEIELSRPLGRKQKVVVRGFSEHHIAKAEARKLYEDITPEPTAEEAEMLRMARLARPFVRAANAGSPDKRERRQLRQMKEGGTSRSGAGGGRPR
jgi:ribosome-associated heat shock protein Hsp15